MPKIQVGNKIYLITNGKAWPIKEVPFKKKKFKKGKDGAWRG